MRHNKQITPLNSTFVVPEGLPDRSDLSHVYDRAESRQINNTHSDMDRFSNDRDCVDMQPAAINQALVALLLTVPIIATFLAALFNYRGSSAYAHGVDSLFPLLSFFVSALCLGAWAISIRFLAKHFSKHNARLSALILIYLFYVSPMLSIVYGTSLYDKLGIITTIVFWAMFNRLAILYIVWASNRDTKTFAKRIFITMLPACGLVVGAILSH